MAIEPQLVSLDVLGTDEDLRAAARAQDAEGFGQRVADGRDESGAVTVTLDPAGRASRVQISTWWRDGLSPSQLGAALLAAYRGAFTGAAAAMGRRLADTAAPLRDAADAEEEVLDDGAWLEDVRHRLGRVQERLEHVERLGRDQPGERVVSGPDGYVRLLVRGATVVDVEVDVHAALEQSPNRLAADALAALQAVH